MAFHQKLLLFVLIQAGGIGFTIAVCYILQQIVAEQFSIGVRYAFLGLAYSTLLYLLVYRKSNIEYILNGLAFASLWFCMVLLAIFIGVYLAVFEPLFSHKFSQVTECSVTGMKSISLHGNEKYSVLFMTFIDSYAIQRFGLACVSDNKDRFLFQTNIQPYRFLNFNQSYRIYESDEDAEVLEIQAYTFSRFKLPSWICSSAPFDYAQLKRSTCFASFFSPDSSSVISGSFAEYSPSILHDSQVNIVVLSEDDLLKNLISFKFLVFLVLYPLTMMSLQFFMFFFLIKLKTFSSIYQNILTTDQHQQKINDLIEEKKEEELEESEQEDCQNNCKNMHTKKYQDSDNTVQTTQALALLHKTLTNQEHITQSFQAQQQQKSPNHNRFSRSHTYDVSTKVSQNYQQQYKTTQSSHRHPLRSNKSSEKHALNLSLSKAISTLFNENQDETPNNNNQPKHSKTAHLSPPKFHANSFQSRRSLNEPSSAGMHSTPNHSISINFYNEDNHLFLEQYNISKPTPVSFQDSNFIIKNQTSTSILNNNNMYNTQPLDSSLNPSHL